MGFGVLTMRALSAATSRLIAATATAAATMLLCGRRFVAVYAQPLFVTRFGRRKLDQHFVRDGRNG